MKRIQRIESILASIFFLFALALIYSNLPNPNNLLQLIYPMGIALMVYLSFISFSIGIVPHFFQKRRIELGLISTATCIFIVWLALAGLLWFEKPQKSFSELLKHELSIGVVCGIFGCMIFYELIKRLIRYLINQDNPLAKRIINESVIAVIASFAVFFLLLGASSDVAAFWITSCLYIYILYAICFYWILPTFEKKKQEFPRLVLVTVLISFLLYIPFGTFFIAVNNLDLGAFLVSWIGLNIFVLPLIYYYFTLQKNRLAELLNLKIELDHTSAGLNFLRSQINPHFLFNILNTLYGTALQEKAEKTSNGIQKLGDMMRFMLHENNQDKILLSREIEYLHNYIDIQLLRTESSPNITVEYSIQDTIGPLYIAPMILIPFVENAFKHGISLQEKSWIRLSLKEEQGVLYFDIHNSIHRKNATDPESKRSGIGLENVRQRLDHLYPDRYDWSVREASHDFYVHITIKL